MNPPTKILVGIIVLVGFLYIIHVIVSAVDSSPALHDQKMEELHNAIPLMVSMGLIIGALTFYLMSSKIETREKILKKNSQTLLKLLNSDEQKVVQILLDNNGKALQYEITRLSNMTKVRTHRIIQRLVDRGVLEKEPFGKVNRIKLASEIKEGLL